MANDKSILEKFTDTVKNIATIASDAANHALSAEQPAISGDERAVVYVPPAADGLVSDPLMIAPITPARKKKRPAAKPTAKKAVKKTARKTAKKPVAKSASKAVKKSPKKANRKSASKTGGKARKTRKATRKTGRAR